MAEAIYNIACHGIVKRSFESESNEVKYLYLALIRDVDA